LIETDLHPTSTGADGKSIFKRSTPKPGDPPDNRVYCAMCGMIFSFDRQASGDSRCDSQSPGIQIKNKVINVATNPLLPALLVGNVYFNAATVTYKDPKVVSGCRFCGTYNPTGKGIDNGDFERSIDVSDL
jgi:hypothetical protein